MSDRRHRSEGGDRAKKLLAWAGWIVLLLLLGGNAVMGLVFEKDGHPQGFVTPDILQAAAFWLPMLAAATMACCGLYWATKAYSHSERSSLLWARRGYVFSLVGIAVLAEAAYEPDVFPRAWLAVLAATIVGGQTVFFGMLSLREYRRSESGGAARRSRKLQEAPRSGEAGHASDSETASTESPGAGG